MLKTVNDLLIRFEQILILYLCNNEVDGNLPDKIYYYNQSIQ